MLLAPFFGLSLISDTVMPVATAAGLKMVICAGNGVVQIRVDPATGLPAEDETQGTAARCDWAAAHVAAALTTFPVRVTLPVAMPAAAPIQRSTILAASRRTGLPPSTGPPAFI